MADNFKFYGRNGIHNGGSDSGVPRQICLHRWTVSLDLHWMRLLMMKMLCVNVLLKRAG